MEHKNKSRSKSFKVAFSGLFHAISTQVNFQIQLLMALVAILIGFYFQLNKFEWLILILTIALVLLAELFNTVIEVVVDLAVKEKLLPDAKIAKDVSAAAVLLISIVSIVVGVLLFLPHLLNS